MVYCVKTRTLESNLKGPEQSPSQGPFLSCWTLKPDSKLQKILLLCNKSGFEIPFFSTVDKKKIIYKNLFLVCLRILIRFVQNWLNNCIFETV